MGLEAATYIHQLNPLNPVGAVDPKAQGDDHLRMIKSALQATFPNLTGAMTATQANLNQWAGLASAYAWTGQHAWSLALKIPDGLVNAPGIQFNSDPNTGFFSVGADQIGITAGGVRVMHIVAAAVSGMTIRLDAGQSGFPNGTAGAPSYSFTSDVDTGIYRGGGDDLAIAAGGVEIAHFTSNAGATPQFRVVDGVPGNCGIAFHADPDTGFYRWGADAFAATSGGAAVMSWRLGQSRMSDGTSGAPALCFENDTAHGFYRAGAGNIRYAAAGAVLMQLTATGTFLAGDPVGNAGSPSYYFLTDLDTGIYRIGADQLGFSEGGVGARIGFRNVPQNIQAGNYTCLATDTGKHIYHANGAGAGDTYTIPANASVAYDIGTAITFINNDSNSVAIAITSDTMTMAGTTSTGTRTLAQNGIATAIKTTATTWLISGTGLS